MPHQLPAQIIMQLLKQMDEFELNCKMSLSQLAKVNRAQLFVIGSLFFLSACTDGAINEAYTDSATNDGGYTEFLISNFTAKFKSDGSVDVYLEEIPGLQSCYSKGEYTSIGDSIYTISGMSSKKCYKRNSGIAVRDCNGEYLLDEIMRIRPLEEGNSEVDTIEANQSIYPPRTHYLHNFLGRVNHDEPLSSNTAMHHDSLGQPLFQTGPFIVFESVIARGDEYFPYSEIEYIDAYLCVYSHTFSEVVYDGYYSDFTDNWFLPFSGEPQTSIGYFETERSGYGEPIKTIYYGTYFELHLPAEGAQSHQYELWFMPRSRENTMQHTMLWINDDRQWEGYKYVGRGKFELYKTERVWKDYLSVQQNVEAYGSSAFKTITSSQNSWDTEEVVTTRFVNPGTVSYGIGN